MVDEEKRSKKEAEKPPIEAVIFDFDGLLVDSEPLWSEARNQIFNRYGLRYTLSDKRETMGGDYKGGISYFIKKYRLPISVKNFIMQEQSILDELYNQKLRLTPGSAKLLQEIDEFGLLRAIASSGPKNRVDFAIKLLNISGFSVVTTGNDVVNGKPDPELFLKTSNSLGVPANTCVVLEDAYLGIIAARAAAMYSVAVIDKRFSKVGDFKGGAEPDLLVDTLEDLTVDRLLELAI